MFENLSYRLFWTFFKLHLLRKKSLMEMLFPSLTFLYYSPWMGYKTQSQQWIPKVQQQAMQRHRLLKAQPLGAPQAPIESRQSLSIFWEQCSFYKNADQSGGTYIKDCTVSNHVYSVPHCRVVQDKSTVKKMSIKLK